MHLFALKYVFIFCRLAAVSCYVFRIAPQRNQRQLSLVLAMVAGMTCLIVWNKTALRMLSGLVNMFLNSLTLSRRSRKPKAEGGCCNSSLASHA